MDPEFAQTLGHKIAIGFIIVIIGALFFIIKPENRWLFFLIIIFMLFIYKTWLKDKLEEQGIGTDF